MTRHLRFIIPALAILLAIIAAPAPPADEIDRYKQLQAMPRERRVALSANLERFDKLEPAEQAAIRKFDTVLNRKDPVDQARYRALLRRYHLWVSGLSDEQRDALQKASSDDAKLALVGVYRQKEKQAGVTGPRLFGIRPGDYGLVGPHEIAHLLKIWNKIPTTKQTEIEKQQDRAKLFREIRDQNKYYGIVFVPFPPPEERAYDLQLDNNKSFREQLGQFSQRAESTSKKAIAAHSKGEPPPRKFDLQFAEFLYYEAHKPKAVTQRNLERFAASCPNWLHRMLDPLSADDARNYLSTIYRLTYPEPSEMPPTTKAAVKPGSEATTLPPQAKPKKSGAAGPF